MPRSFAITTSEPSLKLSPQGRGELTFTVSNTVGQPVRVRTLIEPEGQVPRDWFTLVGDAERDLAPDGTQSYAVRLSVPPGTPEGQHAFHLLVTNVANPDEQFAIGPSVAFQVQRPAPVARKKFPWWIVAVAAGVLLITAGAITAGVLLRDDEESGQGGSGSEPTVFLSFDGRQSYVDLGNPPELNFTGHITVEAWIRPQLGEGFQNIVAHGYTNTPNGEFILRILANQYQVGSWNGTGFSTSAPMPAEDIGRWVHLAGVYDGTAWRLYRDGKEISSTASATGVLPVNAPWALGARGGASERYFHGDLSQVNLWRVARTPEQIRRDMHHPPKGDEEGLVGSWSLSEGRGSRVRDVSQSSADGILRGATWPPTGAAPARAEAAPVATPTAPAPETPAVAAPAPIRHRIPRTR
jgi:hypothetical protein